jgi:DedD protein
MEEKLESVQAPQSAAARPAEIAQEKSKTKSGDAAPIQAPVAQSPMPRTPPEQIKAGLPTSIAKSERPPVEPDPASPSVAAIAKAMISEESKNERLALNKPSESPAEKISPRAKPVIQTVPLEPVKRAPMSEPPKAIPAPGADRAEASPVEMKPAVAAAIAKENEKAADKAAGEQVALLSKPKEPVIERKPAVIPPVQKALEGFIIQLAFNEREKARHWAEALQRRGYAVSLTEAGVDGALRVRLGNFAVREEAERQLRNLKQDGLTGIIINLPQAFRPEARSSVP